jgi:hypothetical protein
VENYLIPMKAAGLVEPEEERRQWVFHIMVSDRYTEPHDKSEVAQSGSDELPDDEDRAPTLQRATQPTVADIPDFVLPGLAPSAPPLTLVPALVAPEPAPPGSIAPGLATPRTVVLGASDPGGR